MIVDTIVAAFMAPSEAYIPVYLSLAFGVLTLVFLSRKFCSKKPDP